MKNHLLTLMSFKTFCRAQKWRYFE